MRKLSIPAEHRTKFGNTTGTEISVNYSWAITSYAYKTYYTWYWLRRIHLRLKAHGCVAAHNVAVPPNVCSAVVHDKLEIGLEILNLFDKMACLQLRRHNIALCQRPTYFHEALTRPW